MRFLPIGYCLAFVLALSGCASRKMEDDIRRLERSLNDLRAFQSEQTETISSIDRQVRAISGKIEELEYSQNKRLSGDLTALREDLSSIRRRVPPPPGVPANELEFDEVWGKSLTGEIGTLFLDSLQKLREGKFADALSLLQNATEQMEGTDRAPVALYWMGVAYDGLQDDKGALRAYSEVISRYPRSQRAPSSLLRQADVLARLGDKKTASLSLQKLLEDYPRSPEAPRAKEKIKELR